MVITPVTAEAALIHWKWRMDGLAIRAIEALCSQLSVHISLYWLTRKGKGHTLFLVNNNNFTLNYGFFITPFFTLRKTFNFLLPSTVGRAKFFGGQGANVHSIFLSKTWVQKRFHVIYLIFNGAPRASKLGCFGVHFRCATARLWSPRGSIKYQVNYLNSLMHSRFAPKNWMHIGTLTPKKFLSP